MKFVRQLYKLLTYYLESDRAICGFASNSIFRPSRGLFHTAQPSCCQWRCQAHSSRCPLFFSIRCDFVGCCHVAVPAPRTDSPVRDVQFHDILVPRFRGMEGHANFTMAQQIEAVSATNYAHILQYHVELSYNCSGVTRLRQLVYCFWNPSTFVLKE